MKKLALISLILLLIGLPACRGSARVPGPITPTALLVPSVTVEPPPEITVIALTPTATAPATAPAATPIPTPTSVPLPPPAPTLAPDVSRMRAPGPLALWALPQPGAELVTSVAPGTELPLIGLSPDELWVAVPPPIGSQPVLWAPLDEIEVIGRLDVLPIVPDPAVAENFPALGQARSRIQFAPGGISAIVHGQVHWPLNHAFVFRTQAGQEASITVESDSRLANFQFWGAEDGTPYKRFVSESRIWEGTLPRAQDYFLSVGVPEGAASYTMTLTILPSGETFAPPTVLVEGGTGLIVGGQRDGRWLSPELASALLPFDQAFAIYRDGARTGTVPMIQAYGLGGACPVPQMAPADPGTTVEGLLLANAVTPLPRVAQPLPVADDALQQLVGEFLTGAGLPGAQIELRQAWQVDLEGDGSEEVLVAAHRFANNRALPPVAAGDYALLLLVRLVDDQMVAEPLVVDVYFEDISLAYPHAYALVDLLDLNGDGVLEIVVSADRYEGHRMQVYALDPANGAISRVLEAGCDL